MALTFSKYIQALALIFCLLFLVEGLQAQNDSIPAEDSSKVNLIFSRKVQGKEAAEGRYIYLQGDVHFQQQQMHLWCDTAHRYPTNEVLAYGNVQMLQDDSIRIFSDSLFYNGDNRKARLSGDVVLQDSTMTIFTDELLYDLNTKIADYPNGVLLITDSTQLVSKSGQYDANTNIAYFTDSVRLTDPNYKLTADSLAFDTDKEIAKFLGPTFIFDDENMLYCEDGYYDNRNNYAELTGREKQPYYLKRAENGDYEKALADTIIYDGRKDKYYLIGDAVFEDGKNEVRADTIVRDGKTDAFYFGGKSQFRNLDSTKTQTIDALNSFYDSKTETMYFRDEVRVVDENQILEADSLDYSQKTNTGIARGHVVWVDTAANVQIMCGEAIYNDSTKAILAKDYPIMMTVLDKDSLWMTSDTLRALPDSTNEEKRIFYAYNNVKIFKSDLQGLCDSLIYSELDSLFEFHQKPILWADSVQFVADTITAKMKNQQMDQVFLEQNALIVSTEEEKYFNQIKGKEMLAQFRKNKLKVLDVDGNGEAIYYLVDEQKRYMGVNDVDCVNMRILFVDNQVDQIKFYKKPSSVMYPMGQAPHKTLRLKGFAWHEAKRPKSKFDVTQGRAWKLRKLIQSDSSFSISKALEPKIDSLTIVETPTPPPVVDSSIQTKVDSSTAENQKQRGAKQEQAKAQKDRKPKRPLMPKKPVEQKRRGDKNRNDD
jgi:lipopolysaccharide export system protein LptA